MKKYFGFMTKVTPPTPYGQTSTTSAEVVADVNIIFRRFVFDEMPIRLIHLSTMTLVERDNLIPHFLPVMKTITEEAIQTQQEQTPSATRKQIILEMVRERVRYAILSHRWLIEGEPLYTDMTGEKRPSGVGYDKLKKFCHQAALCNVQFAWSDTCCINKSSSSELDESIRSMFRWYRNSTICIIYLANTVALDDVRADEWFTRGWTLQELLAPRIIKFHGADWNPLTDATNDLDHTGILKQIEQATTIRVRFLQGRQFEPGPKNISERMCWAAGRVTSRGEDRAYSLMGIFGVNIAPAYGEGPDQAFFRLIQALLHVSNDLDVLNWAGEPVATSHPTRMLPSSPDCYSTESRLKFQALNSPQSLVLTNRGLQLKLLIINATLSATASNLKGFNHATFSPDRRFVEEAAVEVTGLSEAVNNGVSFDYAFGVWNIVELEYGLASNLAVPAKMTGCLMTRILPGPWRRIPTKECIVLTPSNWLRSRSLDRELQTVFL
ncbi:HET-domain-containing protein [Gyrodon lividus]|nr:HET-domain-containing protein [Gyrodon lividus]